MNWKTNSLKTKLLTGVIAGGVIFSTASMAFANTNFNKVNPKKINCDLGLNGEKAKRFSSEKFTAKLGTLVTNGTITAEQKTAIQESLKKSHVDRKAEFDKMKNMTTEERKTYKTKLKAERKSPIQNLVDNKTITQEQADAIAKLLPQKGPKGDHKFKNSTKQEKVDTSSTTQTK